LPQNIVLNGAESHLYRIDLNLIPNGPEKRNFLYNPLLILSLNIVIVIKSIVSVLTPEEKGKFLIIIGDFDHFYGSKTHFNFIIILLTILALNSQLISYYNYKNGIKQKYLKVFDMMHTFCIYAIY
jgi:hypothetical protein